MTTTLDPAAGSLLTALTTALVLLAAPLATAHHHSYRQATAELLPALHAWHWDAVTDPLTAIPNRSAGQTLLDRTAEADTALLVGLVDVDDFKSVNDTYSPPAGDQALQAVATVLSTVADPDGPTARYGGDEFALFLPGTADADRVAGRIQAALADHAERHPDPPPLTVSIGWATTGQIPVNQVLQAADTALADAKQTCRDRSSVRGAQYQPEPLPSRTATVRIPAQPRSPLHAVGSYSGV